MTLPIRFLGDDVEHMWVDTGCYDVDAMLIAPAFDRAVAEFDGAVVREWTTAHGKQARTAEFAEISMLGTDYPKVVIGADPGGNDDPPQSCLGLRLLARHRVTFDFPRRRMYLSRISVDALEPIADELQRRLTQLAKCGKLPGLPENGSGRFVSTRAPKHYDERTYRLEVDGDSSNRFYTLARQALMSGV